MTRLAIAFGVLLISGRLFCADVPTAPNVSVTPSTNSYHLSFVMDPVQDATWYSIIVRSNGLVLFRRYAMTNFLTVSNLSGNLDAYTFTATATNAIGESDESLHAPLHLVILTQGTNRTVLEPTNSPMTFTNRGPLKIEKWDAFREMKDDP